ncbi:PTS transporter subunit EIIC [Mycobacteroides abscessus]|uniref:PTS transporter subunit EIIC n=1 Tax=unclassified Desemzia TaxID=2685243 RepID=UPI0009A5FE39|nr:EIIBCA-Bgl [Mycobacteroides abscessus subsp. abscessus]
MDYKKIAAEVVGKVGGNSNIVSVTHCMTRLRFVLKDNKQANDEEIKKIPGVLGVAVSGGQYQVIIGTEVSSVYTEIVNTMDVTGGGSIDVDEGDIPKEDGNLFNRFFKLISGIIFPVMGVMTAGGIIKGVLAGLTSFNVLSEASGTYQILYSFADGFFYFLPVILGFSAANKFKSNPYIGATIGAALVYPSIVSFYNEGIALTFLKIPVVLTSYGNSVFPIIAGVAVAAYIEKKIDHKMPTTVKLFATPLITLIITVPLTFLVVGPIMTIISDFLASGTQSIYNFSPILTGVILGAFWQLVVIFGLHYAFIPILINNIATLGADPINAILNVTIFALAGSAIGFAMKQKNKEKRALGFSTGITGLFGVTEPIIYGVALPYKKPFIAAFIGGGIAGGITAGMGAKMFGFGGNAIFAAPLFINPEGIDNSFTAYIIASLIAFFVPLVISYIITIKEEVI